MGFRYVSIFSGVEAATLAWEPLGWEPVAFSDILEPNPPQRFSLSPTACQGILNRAVKRGRSLPAELDAALRAQASSTPLRPAPTQ